MAAQIAQCTRSRQLIDMPPCQRNGGIQQHILIVGRMNTHDFAELAGLHQFSYILVCRIHDVGKTAVVDDALFLRKICQDTRLLCGKAERLFTKDLFSVLQRRLCHLKVHTVRCSDIHQIDLRIGDDIHPAGSIPAISHLLRKGSNLLLADITDQLEYRHIVSKNHSCIMECSRMCLAHPARADQTNFNLFHNCLLLIPLMY